MKHLVQKINPKTGKPMFNLLGQPIMVKKKEPDSYEVQVELPKVTGQLADGTFLSNLASGLAKLLPGKKDGT